MQQKKMILLAGVIAVIIVVIAGWLVATAPPKNSTQVPEQQNTQVQPTKDKICPEAWYDNRMPGPAEEPSGNSQYFIVNGQRVEFEELDVEWIKANCSVKEPERVY